MSIRILPDDIVNKIAAGEVVERPASVVKELVENSIDAGATSINITYEGGGLSAIRIADNGRGIAKEDLSLAFDRHATSKITNITDLENIKSMGFRGEALASIASVAKVSLRSRTKDSEFGYELAVAYGTKGEVTKVGMPAGAEIKVEGLFEELPARKKFVKTPQTEAKHINALITSFALAHPAIAFELHNEGRQVLSAPAVSSLQERLHAIWDNDLVGKLKEVFFEHPHLTVRGFIGTPQLSGSTAAQWLFVNQRPVEDRAVFAAVREGYAGLLPPKGRPFFILFIQTPPHLVDVNVHPRKQEVRFASNQFVFQSVKQAVRSALDKHDLTPIISSQLSVDSSPRFAGEAGYQKTTGINKQISKYPNMQIDSVRDVGSGYKQSGLDKRGMVLHDAAFTDIPSAPLPWEEKRDGLDIRFHVLDNVFVFVFGIDSITVYDQHALHERVLFEKFKQNFEQGVAQGDVQTLLIPQKLRLSPEQDNVLEEQKEVLDKLGFRIERIEDREIEIQAVPVYLKDTSIQSFLPEILSEWNEVESLTADREIALATMACRAAVKAGDQLSEPEIRSLLEQVSLLDEKYTCPHGRPFKVIITRKEIDTWFKRTGF